MRTDTKTGYKGVNFRQGKPRPYQLQIRVEGHQQYFGYYATAEEAALEYARHVGSEQAAQEAAEAAPPMTAEEALAKAEDEGLVLVRSGNTVGSRVRVVVGKGRYIWHTAPQVGAPLVFRPSKLHLGCVWRPVGLCVLCAECFSSRHGLGAAEPGGSLSSLPSPGTPSTDRSALPLAFSFTR